MKNNTIQPNIASQIKHEIITPLTCILSLLGSLNRTRISDQQAGYLHGIEDSVISLINIQDKINCLIQQKGANHY